MGRLPAVAERFHLPSEPPDIWHCQNRILVGIVESSPCGLCTSQEEASAKTEARWRPGTGPLEALDEPTAASQQQVRPPFQTEDEEVDPLDAFMSGVSTEVKQNQEAELRKKMEARLERVRAARMGWM